MKPTTKDIEREYHTRRITLGDVYRHIDTLNSEPNNAIEYYFHHKTGTIQKKRISDTL